MTGGCSKRAATDSKHKLSALVRYCICKGYGRRQEQSESLIGEVSVACTPNAVGVGIRLDALPKNVASISYLPAQNLPKRKSCEWLAAPIISQ